MHKPPRTAPPATAHLGQVGGHVEAGALAIGGERHALRLLHRRLVMDVLAQEAKHLGAEGNMGYGGCRGGWASHGLGAAGARQKATSCRHFGAQVHRQLSIALGR